MSKAVLTFDYELFLGDDTGTAECSILQPTAAILKLLKKYNAKAIFFVDATYLLVLKKYNSKDFISISKQLREIMASNSSVELHLHPQWLDAVPNGERWSFKSFEHYRLHSLHKERIGTLFKEGVSVLEDITGKKVQAFRAGGWSITPFQVLKDAFIENGIVLDMSVCPGFYKDALPMHYYDFRKAPGQAYYRFSDDVCSIDSNGMFLEIPVTTYEMSGVDLAINTIFKRFKNDPIYGDGKGLASANVRGNILKRLMQKNLRKATIEGQSNYFFQKSLKKLKDRALLSYVMHPKTINQEALANMEYLLQHYRTLNSDDLLKEYF